MEYEVQVLEREVLDTAVDVAMEQEPARKFELSQPLGAAALICAGCPMARFCTRPPENCEPEAVIEPNVFDELKVEVELELEVEPKPEPEVDCIDGPQLQAHSSYDSPVEPERNFKSGSKSTPDPRYKPESETEAVFNVEAESFGVEIEPEARMEDEAERQNIQLEPGLDSEQEPTKDLEKKSYEKDNIEQVAVSERQEVALAPDYKKLLFDDSVEVVLAPALGRSQKTETKPSLSKIQSEEPAVVEGEIKAEHEPIFIPIPDSPKFKAEAKTENETGHKLKFNPEPVVSDLVDVEVDIDIEAERENGQMLEVYTNTVQAEIHEPPEGHFENAQRIEGADPIDVIEDVDTLEYVDYVKKLTSMYVTDSVIAHAASSFYRLDTIEEGYFLEKAQNRKQVRRSVRRSASSVSKKYNQLSKILLARYAIHFAQTSKVS